MLLRTRLHGLHGIMDTEFDTDDKREAHARAMLQKMTAHEKQRLWRWALRGIVIQ